MKISLEWLNSYLDSPVTAEQAEAVLMNQGLPIEERKDLGGGNAMLDVEVTSNRSDCLCHIGLAREVAAGTGKKLKLPEWEARDGSGSGGGASGGTVKVEEAALCPLYTARVIRGVKIGASPAWLVRRLEAVGLRAVNNVVDVTNYVLHEMGQPLHAFDLAKLGGRAVVVRRARKGEVMTAIDGSRHTLSEGMLVIADASRPVAVAGVMGGLETEVGAGTSEILLESAIFAPLAVRQTSRALKLASDSSYRFERGVDPNGVDRASQRAARLICEIAGGKVEGAVVRVGMGPVEEKAVSLRPRRCRALLGMEIRGKEMVEILGRLGLSPRVDREKRVIACAVPTFRLDLSREVDLIEEVGRMAGLDRVKKHARVRVDVRAVQATVAAARVMRRVLAAYGYLEAVTFSFIAPKYGQMFLSSASGGVMIDDERRKSEPMLRPSLLPSLLLCRKSNQDAGNSAVQLFEVAATWERREGKIVERQRLALVKDAVEPGAAMRELRGAVEELVERLGGHKKVEFEPATRAYFGPGALPGGAVVKVDGQAVGEAGILSGEVQKQFDLLIGVAAAELDAAALIGMYPPARQVKGLARFPGIERDLSIVVDEGVRWEQIEKQVAGAGPALLESLWFLTAYRGKPIPGGKKSVSFRMLFRDPGTTLRHEQVDPQVNLVVETLKKSVGAELRA